MSDRRLVLLRHGRTEWNARGIMQGQTDVGIDETGHAQAAAVAPAMAKLGPSVLWSSDLVRAKETAHHVAEATGLAPTYDARLREFSLGEREGLPRGEYAAAHPEEFARFVAGDWDDIPGAELRADVAARFTAAMSDVADALEEGETAVVVAHGAAIRTGTAAWLGWPLQHAQDLRGLANCAWLQLTERPSGRWALAAYNLTAADAADGSPDFIGRPPSG